MNLVIGATGRVGRAVADELLRSGRPVRVLVRSAEKGAALAARGCEIAVGDVTNRASLEAALRGVTGIANMLGTPRGPKTRPTDYAVIEGEGERNLMAAVEAAGSKPHLVYLSGMHVDRAPSAPIFRYKVEMEAALKSSGLPYTILRPTLLMGFFTDDLVRNGVAQLAGRFPHPVSPVHAGDVGLAAARCLGDPNAYGHTYELFGPEKMGFVEAIERWSRESGQPVTIRRMPLFAFRVVSILLAFQLPVLRSIYPLIRACNEYDWSGDPETLRTLIGREPTTLAQFARRGK